MTRKFREAAVIGFVLLPLVCGCVHVRTYSEDKARVDQDLSSGNQGSLGELARQGADLENRKMTRKTYVAEVEFGRSHKPGKAAGNRAVVQKVVPQSAGQPAQEAVEAPQTAQTSLQATNYVVQANDTLQKISMKVYGTSKKWKDIFEANSDKLKSPDKVYAGQELKIP